MLSDNPASGRFKVTDHACVDSHLGASFKLCSLIRCVRVYDSEITNYSIILLKLIDATTNIIASKSAIAAKSIGRLAKFPLIISSLTASTM